MHTPDDPARARLRTGLRELSRALIPLHRRLIEETRSDYAFAHGPVDSPSHLLQLLQSDPFFEWLRPVTALIVDIDEMTRTDFAEEAAHEMAGRAERFFGGEAEESFASRYRPILQRDVDVAMGHAAVRQVLAKLKMKSDIS
ncbi:MAG TPA: hypothetical protein VMS98_16875 [Thermoanaerobaculia bacterium]|nr:hypothetical protein [Thermoanaerobaculia bacterium]